MGPLFSFAQKLQAFGDVRRAGRIPAYWSVAGAGKAFDVIGVVAKGASRAEERVPFYNRAFSNL